MIRSAVTSNVTALTLFSSYNHTLNILQFPPPYCSFLPSSEWADRQRCEKWRTESSAGAVQWSPILKDRRQRGYGGRSSGRVRVLWWWPTTCAHLYSCIHHPQIFSPQVRVSSFLSLKPCGQEKLLSPDLVTCWDENNLHLNHKKPQKYRNNMWQLRNYELRAPVHFGVVADSTTAK